MRGNISIFFLTQKVIVTSKPRFQENKPKKKVKIENIRKMKDFYVLPPYPQTLFFVAFVLDSKIIEVFIDKQSVSRKWFPFMYHISGSFHFSNQNPYVFALEGYLKLSDNFCILHHLKFCIILIPLVCISIVLFPKMVIGITELLLTS